MNVRGVVVLCKRLGIRIQYPFSVNANESEYSKIDESGNIYESGKISSSVNLVLNLFLNLFPHKLPNWSFVRSTIIANFSNAIFIWVTVHVNGLNFHDSGRPNARKVEVGNLHA